ncbi:MAG: class I adenylate-forming enzyme family protein [Candidatus Melainabacteria bacterium]
MSRLVARIAQHAQDSSRRAVVQDDVTWTFHELTQNVNRLASRLVNAGIQPGDRVAMIFSNQKEFLLALLAIRQMGGVAVPINIQMPPGDILYVMLNSGSKLILADKHFAGHLGACPIPVWISGATEGSFTRLEDELARGDAQFQPPGREASEQLHLLLYTSGTTDKPKGVMLSEENLLANIEGFDALLHLAPDEHILLALPLFHAFGLIVGLYGLTIGATIALVPNFSPKQIVSSLTAQKITVLPLVPTMFRVVLQAVQKHGQPLPHLKYAISGGASLPKELLRAVESGLGVTLLEGYGLTETAPVLAVNTPAQGSIPGSVGQILPNVSLKLVDDSGKSLPIARGNVSAEGEILVKGPNVMAGYYNLPEATAEAFDAEGYFRTGDLGHVDADGNLFISGGRKKDLIIKAGENIAPLRIEQVLYQHPQVAEACVVGVPDERTGEEILACIQLKPLQDGETAPDENTLRKFCAEHLSPLFVPKFYRFFDELPKTATGKVSKKLLKTQLNALQPA